MLRLIFVPFIVNAVIDSNYGTALILFVLAGISDGLDGVLARASTPSRPSLMPARTNRISAVP